MILRTIANDGGRRTTGAPRERRTMTRANTLAHCAEHRVDLRDPAMHYGMVPHVRPVPRCTARHPMHARQVRCEERAGHSGAHFHSFFARSWENLE